MNVLGRYFGRLVHNAVYNPLYPNVINRTIAYKSALSLENLYPNSSLKLTTPSKPSEGQHQKFNGYIPVEELDITYSRSSGPGGQNVNKVNTKVDVRFKIETAKWLNDDIKKKLIEKYQDKLTKDGYLVFRSDLTRYQQMNLADCLEKIRASVRECLVEKTTPTPETQERIRRRIEKAARERLAIKRHRSDTKAGRRDPEVRL
ncbi:peptidyl-tRNA hydrolase ICT1, mitochondrial [Aethina tumida]|uniref:peptidyl-tRNA hydrolase ICT1, mitochondrial n=1 Tax=Aethina tumida TaxID=116153 RepID=UPI00096B0D97|nr:peptidyl-tRNA hydrolase ICT1, mitochondrial [Aethina tumida]